MDVHKYRITSEGTLTHITQLLRFCQGLRRRFVDAILVVAVEGNYYMPLATDLVKALNENRDTIGSFTMLYECEKHPAAPVVIKTPKSAHEYVKALNCFLRTGRVFFAPEVDQEAREDLVRQLAHYQWDLRPVNDPVRGDTAGVWSGKVGGKQDDVAVSFLQCVYYALIFMVDRKYAGARRSPPYIAPGLTLVERVAELAPDAMYRADEESRTELRASWNNDLGTRGPVAQILSQSR